MAICQLLESETNPIMKTISVLALSLLLALGSGCRFFRHVSPQPVAPVAPVESASAQLNFSDALMRSRVAANISTARRVNASQPDSPNRSTIEGELSLGESRLGTRPDAEELLAGEQRARALAEGKADTAKELYASAMKQALSDAESRAKAESDLRLALDQNRRDNLAYQQSLQELKARHTKELEQAHSETLRSQVKWLNIVGAAGLGLGILAIGLGLGLGGLPVLRSVGPIALASIVGGLLSLGLAQIVGQWWFKWAALSSAAFIVGWVAVWVWRHHRLGDLQTQAAARADSYKNALQKIVPVLDEAYESAEQATKDSLDKGIFEKLSSIMNRADKAVVHTIRADQ